EPPRASARGPCGRRPRRRAAERDRQDRSEGPDLPHGAAPHVRRSGARRYLRSGNVQVRASGGRSRAGRAPPDRVHRSRYRRASARGRRAERTAGRGLTLDLVEEGLRSWRANTLSDEDGRPLGEVASPLYEHVTTDVVRCPYPDSRRGAPMNATAL